MAIRTFNSVGGFSVGETPETIILANGDITTDNATLTGVFKTDTLKHLDGSDWDFQQPAGSTNGQIQYYLNGDFGATSKFVFDPTSNVLTVTGNVAANNITTSGYLESSTEINAPTFNGNLVGNVVGNVTGNINIGGSDQSVMFIKGSNAFYSSTLQFNYNTNVLTLDGNLIASNINGGNLVTSNYFHGKFDATSSSQPNITTVGTLVDLDVAGTTTTANTNTGNLSVTSRVITSLVPGNDNTYDLGSSSYQWRNAWVGSNVFIGGTAGYIRAIGNVIYTDAQHIENNVNAGSITVRGEALLQSDVTVSGNLTVSGSTTYINVTNMDIKDPLISIGGSGSGANLTQYDGKDRGLWIRNRTTDDSAVENQAFIWSTGSHEFKAMTGVTITNEVVTAGTYANIHADTFIGNVQGTILTPSQLQITDVGTLNNANVAGTLKVSTNANIASLVASGLQYPTTDGTQRQVLSTDGAGSLYFATIDTYRLANGTSNVTVAGPGPDYPEDTGGDVTISVAGTSNVVVVTDSGATVNGYLDVTSTATVGDVIIGDTNVGAATYITSSILQQDIISLPLANFRAVEFFVKGEDTTSSKFSVATISAVHDGSTEVNWSTYGGVFVGASTGSFDVVIDSGNELLTLQVSPSSSNETVWTVQYRTI